jgi:hypothetical protein
MEHESEIQCCIADDGTDDFLAVQVEGGDETDELRMTKKTALQVAWIILDLYTLEDSNV